MASPSRVIVGTVIDEEMSENLRVTVVATGLGGAVTRVQAKPLTVVKTGTDVSAVEVVETVNFLTGRHRDRRSHAPVRG